MYQLYPEIKPFRRHRLPVGGGHVLYVEESGTEGGVPVLFVHGGPGAACDANSRRFFDPTRFHIICFDQRGCGRSEPHASLADNTTADLLADMEAIRSLVGVDRWMLFGGSWGSTLSLVYAQAQPERVMGLVLRGIFLARKQDLDWFYRLGANRVFPDHWEEFVGLLQPSERKDPLLAYYQRLNGEDEIARMAAAKAWCLWEARCSSLRSTNTAVEHMLKPQRALAMARIETHYFVHDAFLQPNQLLNACERLAGIPAVFVHGRYDMVCPLENALALSAAWPDAELHIIRDAGHSATEPATVDALVRATDAMARQFQNH